MGDLIGAFQQLAFVETYLDSDLQLRVRDSFRITPSFGAVWYTSVDLGFPDVRSSVQDNPQADGTYDETQYTGARMVSIEGVALQDAFGGTPAQSGWDPRIGWNSASWFTRYLSGWASPRRRFKLYFTDDSGQPKFMDVRGDSFSSTVDKLSNGYRNFQINLVNPSGRTYSFDTAATSTSDGRSIKTVSQQTQVDQVVGRTYPLTEPRSYPATNGQTTKPTTTVPYSGSVANGFVANVYTLSGNPTTVKLVVTSPDNTVRTIGLSKPGGFGVNYVITIDTNERTIKGRPSGSGAAFDNLSQYVIAPLQWPSLQPELYLGGSSVGLSQNKVALVQDTGAATAYADIIYNAADLT